MVMPSPNPPVFHLRCKRCGHRWTRKQTGCAMPVQGPCPKCQADDLKIERIVPGSGVQGALQRVWRALFGK